MDRLSNNTDFLPDTRWRQRFRRRLRTWYARHARDLPWRRSTDPYRVWVSEIMLQQTQVATVESYFKRFVRAFPHVRSLARAEEEKVLRLWEGLGYYRRARQLHQAAKMLVEQYEGHFPREVTEVRRLPGIGRYTAGAILSIAFGLPEPILEANTIRLYSRLMAFRKATGTAAGQRYLWKVAETLVPRREPGMFNQALMELGSEVCSSQSPQCEACPVASLCLANAKGLQGTIPVPKTKRPLEDRHEVALLLWRKRKVLLVRQREGGRWAGLWDFPRFQVHGEHADAVQREILDRLRSQTGMVVRLGKRLTRIKHGVTRFRITLDCYEARYVKELNEVSDLPEIRWLRPSELESYPLNSTGRKLCRLCC